jgi:Hypothetical protein (DUF2513)
MKRNMELIRKILLAVESWPPEGGDPTFTDLGRPEEEVTYNLYQAIEAGLLRGAVHEDSSGMVCVVSNLTPYGHDFLDNARSQYIWDEVMDDIKKRGIVSASVDIVKDMLDKTIRKKIEK